MTEATAVHEAVQEAVDIIREVIRDTIDQLREERDEQYESEIETLDEEVRKLAAECVETTDAQAALAPILPSKIRECQRKADALLMAGDREGAEAALAEMREAENVPAAAQARLRELDERAGVEIPLEKKGIARRCFYEWRESIKPLNLAMEHELFINLLNEVDADSDEFASLHNLNTLDTEEEIREDNRRCTSIRLISPEGSEEWKAAHHWYRVYSR